MSSDSGVLSPAGPLMELAEEWERKAETLEESGCDHAARHLRQRIAELRELADDYWSQPLTIAEAADYSGFSERYLRELVRAEGGIPDPRNRGQGRIRIPLRNLPRKAALDREPDEEEPKPDCESVDGLDDFVARG